MERVMNLPAACRIAFTYYLRTDDHHVFTLAKQKSHTETVRLLYPGRELYIFITGNNLLKSIEIQRSFSLFLIVNWV